MREFFKALGNNDVVLSSKEKMTALKESFVDTGVGALINVPINFAVVWLAFELEWSALWTSLFLSVLFTVIAIVRKLIIRLVFLKMHRIKKLDEKSSSDD